ncbi:hypothetical protein [Lysinibacillus fusiformis]|uniref:hypothetical protein n=1 Tax=Lysinibacillus fusiformis TaxID=28031 RepID=UPI0036E3FA08
MIVKVGFNYEDDIGYCPTKVGRNINRLQEEFWEWLFDRKNPHPYWGLNIGKMEILLMVFLTVQMLLFIG